MKTVADLSVGKHAKIASLKDSQLSIKLLEMGCVPASSISVLFIAPFGGPIGVSVNGSLVGLRREEASLICIDE